MGDARVGRVLIASLHQAIADVLPGRLAFYENWLHAEGLRDGTIGLAPLYAVLSFLRQEGDAYNDITARAGRYAAEWTVESMRPLRRSVIASLPAFVRRRVVLGVASALVRDSYDGSSARARVRGDAASVDLRASVFCAVREPAGHPLCGFYAAAYGRVFELFDLSTAVSVEACRGTGREGCMLLVPFTHAADEPLEVR
jgi:bacteriochlorophyll 4-vinyl reductase